MATTDTRTGFRLPWSSDRSHPGAEDESAVEESPSTGDALAEDAASAIDPAAGTEAPSAGTPVVSEPPTLEEPRQMIDLGTRAASTPATPRRPSKLVADLSAAIRATVETAREQQLSQLDVEVKRVIDTIREQATEGSAVLRQRSEEDIAAIRDWSKAEVARIRQEADTRISARKAGLEDQLATYAAAVDDRVGEVQAEIARYQAAMDTYVAQLEEEDDPAMLATMAEQMPEPPSFDLSADHDPSEVIATYVPPVVEPEPEAEVAAEPDAWAEPVTEPEPEVEAEVEVNDWAEPVAEPEPEPVADAWAEPVAEPVAAVEADARVGQVAEAVAGSEPAIDGSVEPGPAAPTATDESLSWASQTSDWGESDTAWGAAHAPDRDDVTSRVPVADPEPAAGIAADAVDDTDETVATTDTTDAFDAATEAAIGARLEAVGLGGPSLAEGFAGMAPSAWDPGPETRVTQVVVSGLISVASIASFKRHLGRLPGVRAVTVASGPEGEFMFNVTHEDGVSFRDSIPTMPGFAARITNATDDVIHVVARDPETEG
jgi:hypothetical protein